MDTQLWTMPGNQGYKIEKDSVLPDQIYFVIDLFGGKRNY